MTLILKVRRRRVSKDEAEWPLHGKMQGAYLYIVKCSDGSYYSGTARAGLERRVAEHNPGCYGGYTETRRPVVLVFSQWFEDVTDAIAGTASQKLVAREEGSADPW